MSQESWNPADGLFVYVDAMEEEALTLILPSSRFCGGLPQEDKGRGWALQCLAFRTC
jgi:hypothetical protein